MFIFKSDPESGAVAERLQHMIHSIRTHLQMDVGFISEFKDGKRFFNYVDTASPNPPIVAGGCNPVEESYCHFVVSGALPELMQDAASVPGAAALEVTSALPVGAHLSAPIRLSDGSVYGTFCCFSHKADHSLNQRDLRLLKLYADVAGKLIQDDVTANQAIMDQARFIRQIIERREFSLVYQPIFQMSDLPLVGFEALSRFSAEPSRSPDRIFAEAAAVDLETELDLLVAKAACASLSSLSQSLRLAVNLSPSTISDPRLHDLFADLPVERIILEITEHTAVQNYGKLQEVLAPLRKRGLRLAVDDAGAGHASFKHVLDLKPDLIKLDISLTRNIDCDPARRALTEALTRFGQSMGVQILAEGVETELELTALRDIGVTLAQGFLLGRPMSLTEAASLPIHRGDGRETMEVS